MGVKRQARECALQILYTLDARKEPSEVDVEGAVRGFFDNFDSPERAKDMAAAIVAGVCAERVRLDAQLQQHSPRWKVERMALVDRNVLRLSLWSLLHDEETPARVVIDEGIEIAKRYGADNSAAFVNGVLDSAARALGRLGQEASS
jgi:N utilization substance protein B